MLFSQLYYMFCHTAACRCILLLFALFLFDPYFLYNLLWASHNIFQEISGMPSSLNRESPQNAASPDPMGESSSTGTARLDRGDSFRAL